MLTGSTEMNDDGPVRHNPFVAESGQGKLMEE